MGGPVITFQLVESTPYRLRYLCTGTGGAVTATLPNAGGASPDLRTDSQFPPIDGFLETGVASQAEARHMLMGHDSPSTPQIANLNRGHCKIAARSPGAQWLVDADLGVGGSAGFPVLLVTSPGGPGGETAYLDIKLEHTAYEGE